MMVDGAAVLCCVFVSISVCLLWCAGDTLSGVWQVTEGDPPATFDLCMGSSGSGITGSYSYSLDGSVVQAYESGSCFLGGALCTGLFFEDNGVFGVFMTYLVAPGEARDVWW